MTKKQKIKIIVMSLIIVILLCSLNFILCRPLNSESDVIRVKNFYKLEENSQDMIIIGASTAYTNYSAPLAWKEFGYTSYSLATDMAPMGLAKSMLIEARKTQNPKVFVIDINGVLYNDEQESREGSLRLWLDSIPRSENKTNTINELVPEEDRLAYHIPFIKYHSNWPRFYECVLESIDEINNTDKVNLSTLGIRGNTRREPRHDYVNIKEYNELEPMHKLSGQHLEELLQYCQKENLKNVIFTNMPRHYSKKMLDERGRNNSAKELIKKYGYECIDMDEYVDEIGIDPKVDYYNPNHLNIYGQKKLTKYLGNLLNEKYNLSEGKRDQSLIDRYNHEFASYEKVYNWVDERSKKGEYMGYGYDTVKGIIEGRKGK
ncbi:MAG: hypothetical protein RR585_01015 [Coprobacillus sp.]